MSIVKTIINRPVTFFIIYAMVVGLALFLVRELPIDMYPEITAPEIDVTTNYPSAGPKEVEESITRPLESALSNLNKLKSIKSVSSAGNSSVSLEFEWGFDPYDAINEIRDKLEEMKGFLPKEAENPQIRRYHTGAIPVLQFSLTGTRSVNDLYNIAKIQIKTRLEQVEGVGQVYVMGGFDRIIHVNVAQNRLKAYGITHAEIVQALRAQNVESTAGKFIEGNLEYQIQTSARFASIDDIRNIVVDNKANIKDPVTGIVRPGNQPVYLHDLAEVVDGYSEEGLNFYDDGRKGIILQIQKRARTNAVEVADRIFAVIPSIRDALPAGAELNLLYDYTRAIRASLANVAKSALFGAILAMSVLLLFLRNLKSTITIGLSIPISILVTLMVLYFFGLTLNLLTLAGLALGIGMIVDSSIVILENIYRYREKGSKLSKAAFLGTHEMITPITASVLTTVCIFVPLLMFGNDLGYFGVLFKDMAITIVVALLTSLIVAMSFVPMITSRFLKVYPKKQQNPIRFKPFRLIDAGIEGFFTRLNNLYRWSLFHVLHHRGLTLLGIFLVVVLSFLMLEPFGGNIGIELSPKEDQDIVVLRFGLPPGTKKEVSYRIINELEAIVRQEVQGYKKVFTILESSSSNVGFLYITLPEKSKRIDTFETINQKMRKYYDQYPSLDFNSQRSRNLGSGNPIDIVLRTEDLETAQVLAHEIQEYLKNNVDEIVDVSVVGLSSNESLPLASLEIDRERAYSLGLDMEYIAQEIKTAFQGTVTGRYLSDGKELDILVQLREQDRRSVNDLQTIFVKNREGDEIPLGAISTVKRTKGPTSIRRENRSRMLRISAIPSPDVSLQVADEAVRKAIDENFIINDNIILEYKGELSDLQKYMKKYLIILIIALLMVYGTMASLFESFLDPFIIFLSIILVIPGILILYGVMNLPIWHTVAHLSLFSAIGLLMLAGIAVNNGIVLVDYMNLLRKRGLKLQNAVIEASTNRLRPILMTSFTTILGMIPLAFGRGESSEFIKPLGLTIVGGMTMSTIMTLFLIPILYTFINKKHGHRKKKPVEVSPIESA